MSRTFLGRRPRRLLRDITIAVGLVLLDPNILFFTTGSGLLLLGAALHFWSKGCLTRNWPLTTCGPYWLVRHPFYLANFVVDEGICVLSGNLWLVVLYTVGFLLVYIPTIRKEEAFLASAHADAYLTYSRRVPALIPYRLHKVFGTQGFAWANIRREQEISRLLRILAIPSYFVTVGAAFHEFPATHRTRIAVLCVSLCLALVLNVTSAMLRRRHHEMLFSNSARRKTHGVLRP